MVDKAEDTIYQRHYVSEKRTSKVIEYEGRCRIKSNKVIMVHKGSDVSIGTQPEEESMQIPWIIETTD